MSLVYVYGSGECEQLGKQIIAILCLNLVQKTLKVLEHGTNFKQNRPRSFLTISIL